MNDIGCGEGQKPPRGFDSQRSFGAELDSTAFVALFSRRDPDFPGQCVAATAVLLDQQGISPWLFQGGEPFLNGSDDGGNDVAAVDAMSQNGKKGTCLPLQFWRQGIKRCVGVETDACNGVMDPIGLACCLAENAAELLLLPEDVVGPLQLTGKIEDVPKGIADGKACSEVEELNL